MFRITQKERVKNLLDITKMITLSTSHVSETTKKLLTENETDSDTLTLPVYKKDAGWFICVTDIDPDSPTIPDDLKNLISFAQNIGCDWLCLDSDGQTLPYFEKFHW